MIDVLLPLLLLFLLIYGLYRLPTYITTTSSLPLTRYNRLSQPSTQNAWRIRYDNDVKTLSISTKGLNALPQLIIYRLNQLKTLYDVGAFLGVVGSVAALFVAGWAVKDVWSTVFEEVRAHASPVGHASGGDFSGGSISSEGLTSETTLGRRDTLGAGGTGAASHYPSSAGGLQPLIPGVTVPFSHFPTITLALILSQLFHELGHALSAAIDSVQPSLFSVNIHWIIPSMTVSFTNAVDRLPSQAKIRLSTSGAWHNLLLCITIWLLAYTGISHVFWEDVSQYAVMVTAVAPSSPLQAYLKPGDYITHFDDEPTSGGLAMWDRYLHSDESADIGRGWCIRNTRLTNYAPCLDDKIRFVPATSVSPDLAILTYCLPPHPILDRPSAKCDCSTIQTCIRPSPEEHILRIRINDWSAAIGGAQGLRGSVILWSGPREEVYNTVEVSHRAPRFFKGVVLWSSMFLKYITNISLSLYLFNLLPIPGADGSHLLNTLIAFVFSQKVTHETSIRAPHLQASQYRPSYELEEADQYDYDSDRSGESRDYNGTHDEDMEGGTSGRRLRGQDKWKKRLRKAIEGFTMGLVGSWVIGWLMVALLRSS